jgi:hypothetical protein
MKVPFELVKNMKDCMTEATDQDMQPGQMLGATLVSQVAAQHIFSPSYHFRYSVCNRLKSTGTYC